MSIVYKQPKGTRDYFGAEQLKRDKLIDVCKSIFKLYDAQPMDTPTFELTNVLMQKYPPDTAKQTYVINNDNADIDDKSEEYTLRFDQTVPFSRFIKQNNIVKTKRYQIGKVFRRDQPNIGTCRLREFIQCDYDCLGADDTIFADAEALCALIDIMKKSNIRNDIEWSLRINTKQAIYDILNFCGFDTKNITQVNNICSSIDKLDKKDWDYVENDIINKGFEKDKTIQLIELLKQFKTPSVKDVIEQKIPFLSNQTIDYFKSLFLFYLSDNIITTDKICIDFTLARGLDYYTSLIFEVSTKEVGSVAGGGRYDELCNGINCVGFSVGIDRMMGITNDLGLSESSPKVWIIQTADKKSKDSDTIDDNDNKVYSYRMKVLNFLRNNNVSCGTELKKSCGIANQMRYVLKRNIEYVIFVGPSELKNDTVTLKCITTNSQKELKMFELINNIQ